MGKQKDNGDARDDIGIARGLAEVVAEHSLSELIFETKELKVTVRRGGGAAPVAHAAPAAAMYIPPAPVHHAPPVAAAAIAVVAEAKAEEKGHLVTSPFVGTFYRKPNPDSPNYVQLNEKVEKGAVLCIVEAMKLMNEIEADVGGTIASILVEDGAPVEYGQPLFRIL